MKTLWFVDKNLLFTKINLYGQYVQNEVGPGQGFVSNFIFTLHIKYR